LANADEFGFPGVPGVRIAFEPHVAVKNALSCEEHTGGMPDYGR
jgi:hypothetical protein